MSWPVANDTRVIGRMGYNAVEIPRKSSATQFQMSFLPNVSPLRTIRLAGLSLGALLAIMLSGAPIQAQSVAKPTPEAAPQAVPGFWDPRRRPDRPDLSRLTVIRFLTETDYPPFNFTGPDGNPAGFNVDLAQIAV